MRTAFIASVRSSTSMARSSRRWSIVSWWAIRRCRQRGLAEFGGTGGLLVTKRRWRKLDAERQPVAATDLGVKSRTRADSTLLRPRITGDQAELGPVAFGPLEIVERRPMKITAHWNPRLDCALDRGEVRQEICRA